MIIPRWMKYWQAGIADDVERLGLAIADLEPRTAQLARKGRTVLRRGGPDRRVAAGWRDTMVRWLTDTATDVVLLPATAGDPLPAGSMIGKGYLRTLMVVGAAIPLTQAWNLSGLPALVVPVRVGNRTVGVQLVGRPGGESTLLSIAAALEAAAETSSTRPLTQAEAGVLLRGARSRALTRFLRTLVVAERGDVRRLHGTEYRPGCWSLPDGRCRTV